MQERPLMERLQMYLNHLEVIITKSRSLTQDHNYMYAVVIGSDVPDPNIELASYKNTRDDFLTYFPELNPSKRVLP